MRIIAKTVSASAYRRPEWDDAVGYDVEIITLVKYR